MKHRIFPFVRLMALSIFIGLILTIVTAGRIFAADTNAPIAPDLQVVDQYLLAIPKTGFGRDYQFTASMIPQQLAATSSGLAGKIVRFELFADGVDMYESPAGLVVTPDLPAR